MIDPNFVFSQSNLQTFEYCRYRFYLRYIQHLQWPAQISASDDYQNDLEAGTFFHQLIHQHFLGFERELLLEQARNYPDARLNGWLTTFFNSPYANLAGKLYPETAFTTQIGAHLISAKVDLLQVTDNGNITIYDWKTSRKSPSIHHLKDRFQSKVYPLVVSKRLNNVDDQTLIAMIYWEANFPDKPIIFNFAETDIETIEKELLVKMNEIKSLSEKDFVLTNDIRRCNWCEFRSFCDRGVSAGALPPDTELELSEYEQEIPEGDPQPWG
jgi:ATP-dependent helicase/DNAse subunit B